MIAKAVIDAIVVSAEAVGVVEHMETVDVKAVDAGAEADVFDEAAENWGRAVEAEIGKVPGGSGTCEYSTAAAVKQEAPSRRSAVV